MVRVKIKYFRFPPPLPESYVSSAGQGNQYQTDATRCTRRPCVFV